MSHATPELEPLYAVVVNLEEQYSIWRAEKACPPGWRAIGFSGTRDACLSHIEQLWVDMRPLRARRPQAVQP